MAVFVEAWMVHQAVANVFAMNKKRLLVLKISLVISLLLVLLVIADSIINKRGVHAMTLLLIPFWDSGRPSTKEEKRGRIKSHPLFVLRVQKGQIRNFFVTLETGNIND